jgi:hypothetical protein
MEYTTNKPTEEGWYWTHARTGKEIVVQVVFWTESTGMRIIDNSGSMFSVDDPHFLAFAGPLVPPF